ncbi:MAG: hypothetical protein D6808_06030 [Candidatus Dadabacteria bacterium]|nr:MAG: hypothetical protein D6808_06030 [Candidatus Dadabacteria bacterium]
MANDVKGIQAGSLDPSLFEASNPEPKTQEIGKDQFLKLLVAQLKNQDPLDPQKGDEFAVNLAQFSQVEQLVELNKKLGGDTQNSASLASYLGNEVILDTDKITVSNNDGGILRVNLPTDISSMQIDLIDESGSVVETVNLGESSAGTQTVILNGLDTSSGTYDFKVTAKTESGTEFDVDAKVGGIVTGFIPGPDQVLLLGNREVKVSDIREVYKGTS